MNQPVNTVHAKQLVDDITMDTHSSLAFTEHSQSYDMIIIMLLRISPSLQIHALHIELRVFHFNASLINTMMYDAGVYNIHHNTHLIMNHQ